MSASFVQGTDQNASPAIVEEKRSWKFERDAAKASKTKGSEPAGTQHQQLVRTLTDKGAGYKNFPAAMRRLGVTTSVRPDAWFTREELRHLEVYEVVVCNPVDQNKRVHLRRLVRHLRAVGWTVAFCTLNRRGITKELKL